MPLIKGTAHQRDFSCGEYNVNGPFNVFQLFPFDVDDNLRTNLSEEEGNDGDHNANDRDHNTKDQIDWATMIQLKDMR